MEAGAAGAEETEAAEWVAVELVVVGLVVGEVMGALGGKQAWEEEREPWTEAEAATKAEGQLVTDRSAVAAAVEEARVAVVLAREEKETAAPDAVAMAGSLVTVEARQEHVPACMVAGLEVERLGAEMKAAETVVLGVVAAEGAAKEVVGAGAAEAVAAVDWLVEMAA